MKFQKAERKHAKLRLAMAGPSGAGKTLGALLIAKGIGGRISVIDSENSSASLYSESLRMHGGEIFEPPEFDVLDMKPPYSPDRYCQAIKLAEDSGYDVIVIDSVTHEWSGAGGCLEINDNLAKSKYKGNTWSAWSDTTVMHRKFMDCLIQSKAHIIVTCRSKTETAQTDDGFKKKVVKLGMKAEQRDGFEYEFTVFLDLMHEGHYATAAKDRTGIFASSEPKKISESTGREILSWLQSGSAVVDQLAEMIKGIEDAEGNLEKIKGILRANEFGPKKTESILLPALKAEVAIDAVKTILESAKKGVVVNEPV